MKKMKLFITSALLSTALSMTVLAGEWKQDDTGWWYQNDDGNYPAEILKQIDGLWYYFNNSGYMQTGNIQFSDGWLNFRPDGSCSNPISQADGIPVRAPGAGWIAYNGIPTSTSMANEIIDGRVVLHNGVYWMSPDFYNDLKNLVAQEEPVKGESTSTLQPGTKVDFSGGYSDGNYDDEYDDADY